MSYEQFHLSAALRCHAQTLKKLFALQRDRSKPESLIEERIGRTAFRHERGINAYSRPTDLAPEKRTPYPSLKPDPTPRELADG